MLQELVLSFMAFKKMEELANLEYKLYINDLVVY
jgi:hypothetical protein